MAKSTLINLFTFITAGAEAVVNDEVCTVTVVGTDTNKPWMKFDFGNEEENFNIALDELCVEQTEDNEFYVSDNAADVELLMTGEHLVFTTAEKA